MSKSHHQRPQQLCGHFVADDQKGHRACYTLKMLYLPCTAAATFDKMDVGMVQSIMLYAVADYLSFVCVECFVGAAWQVKYSPHKREGQGHVHSLQSCKQWLLF